MLDFQPIQYMDKVIFLLKTSEKNIKLSQTSETLTFEESRQRKCFLHDVLQRIRLCWHQKFDFHLLKKPSPQQNLSYCRVSDVRRNRNQPPVILTEN